MGGVALAILILLVMITIHEFGHYVAGKILKFKINEFAIGFGPAIFKHKNKKTGEQFSVRLIPLGGYCAFEGEDGLEEDKASMPEDKAQELFPDVNEAKVEEHAEGVAQEPKPTREGVFTEKKPWQRIIVLFAGAFMNYILALLLILVMFSAYGQSVIKVRGMEASAEYAAECSLQEGDILLEANGRKLYLTTDLAQALSGKKKGDTVEFRVANKGVDGAREELKRTVVLRDDVNIANSTQVSVVWRALGIGIEELEDGKYYMLDNASYRFGFFETIGRSFMYSFKVAGSIFRVLGELLTGKLGLSAVGGPVTTITMTSQIASSGFRNFLEITAYIGVNLAVFNLLPIPALDGSKIVFTVIEWIRGKPISRKVEAAIHAVGFVLLLGFAVLVDILQFI